MQYQHSLTYFLELLQEISHSEVYEPPHSAKILARVLRSLRELTRSNRVVILESFGGTYVPSGIAAYVRGCRSDVSHLPKTGSKQKANALEIFMVGV